MDSLYIAWKYMLFNRGKTFVLITCVTLIALLPLSLQSLLRESEQQLSSRAASTPLLLGAKGSALDLVMNSLYFDDEIPETISMQAEEQAGSTGLVMPIPLYIRFHARGFPIVGTSLDYFEFRQLKVAAGRMLVNLGECMLGAEVAEQLGLGVGDSLVSSPENLFDIAGVYPLKMKVVGVLARSHSADDRAIFADIKTTWVIQGLGHGHEDLSRTQNTSVILKRDKGTVTANAKLVQATEITAENIDSFHFHGDSAKFPTTAVLLVPETEKSAALLRGRFLDDEKLKISVPKEVIQGLLENIFRIKNVIDAVIVIVGFATLLVMILVFVLSLRLRQAEIDTITKLGCSRTTIARLLSAEILLILLVSLTLCGVLMTVVNHYSPNIVRMALF